MKANASAERNKIFRISIPFLYAGESGSMRKQKRLTGIAIAIFQQKYKRNDFR
jgi:hypothetical protein